jgi:hypothetical protein
MRVMDRRREGDVSEKHVIVSEEKGGNSCACFLPLRTERHTTKEL